MARGQQKIQSQQKNAEKQAKMKKQQGHDQKKAAQAALMHVCAVCKVRFWRIVCAKIENILVLFT